MGWRCDMLQSNAQQVRFLAWLDGQVRAGNPHLTEWNVSAKFDEIRRKLPLFKGLAYENISATGANAGERHCLIQVSLIALPALPHYAAGPDSPRLDLTTPYLKWDAAARCTSLTNAKVTLVDSISTGHATRRALSTSASQQPRRR